MVLCVLFMALYAETHVEPVDLINLIHASYITMTRSTLKSALYVSLMGEVNVARHRINLVPGNRLFLRPVIPDFGYLLLNVYCSAVEIIIYVTAGNVGVATHALLERRYARVGGYVHEAVTVLAGELISVDPRVNFMAESDRLSGAFITAFSVI